MSFSIVRYVSHCVAGGWRCVGASGTAREWGGREVSQSFLGRRGEGHADFASCDAVILMRMF